MDIQWDDSLVTGDKEIDIHHKAFFVKAQKMADACRTGRGPDVIEEMIEFMVQYAQHHFKAEEQRMDAIKYAYAGSHQAQHAELLATLEGVREKLARKGPTAALAEEINEMVLSWLYDHIKSADIPLIEQLREKLGGSLPAGEP